MLTRRLLAPAAVVMLLVGIAAVDRGVTNTDGAPTSSVGLAAPGSPSSLPSTTPAPTDAGTDAGTPTGASASAVASPSSPSSPPTSSDPTPEASATAQASATPGPNELAGIEVIPEVPGSTPTGLPLPELPAVPAFLVSRPLPVNASSRGRLTAGYPRHVLPPVPGSRILTSSVSPSADRLQVALTGRSTFPVETQLRFFRKKLGRLGFEQRPVSSAGGSTTAGFVRGSGTSTDSVVVTVTVGADGGYTVYAALRAAG